MSVTSVALIVFSLINIYTFLVMAIDKHKAAHNHGHTRTPEGYLFFLAASFGAVGVYVGMLLFHHKTRKWYFKVGIPLLIIQNVAFLYTLKIFFKVDI